MLLFLPSVVPDSRDYKTWLAVRSARIQSKIRPDQDPNRIHRFWTHPDPDLDPVHCYLMDVCYCARLLPNGDVVQLFSRWGLYRTGNSTNCY